MSPLQVEMIWRGAPVMGRSSPTGKEISRDATRNLFIPHIKYLLTPFRSEIAVFLHTTQTRHCFHWLKQECFFHQVLSDVPKGRRKTGLCNLSCYVFMCVTCEFLPAGHTLISNWSAKHVSVRCGQHFVQKKSAKAAQIQKGPLFWAGPPLTVWQISGKNYVLFTKLLKHF